MLGSNAGVMSALFLWECDAAKEKGRGPARGLHHKPLRRAGTAATALGSAQLTTRPPRPVRGRGARRSRQAPRASGRSATNRGKQRILEGRRSRVGVVPCRGRAPPRGMVRARAWRGTGGPRSASRPSGPVRGGRVVKTPAGVAPAGARVDGAPHLLGAARGDQPVAGGGAATGRSNPARSPKHKRVRAGVVA